VAEQPCADGPEGASRETGRGAIALAIAQAEAEVEAEARAAEEARRRVRVESRAEELLGQNRLDRARADAGTEEGAEAEEDRFASLEQEMDLLIGAMRDESRPRAGGPRRGSAGTARLAGGGVSGGSGGSPSTRLRQQELRRSPQRRAAYQRAAW